MSSSRPEGEAELVARARRDPEAFAELYRRHYPVIARYLERRVGAERAADLVAETFLTALEKLPGYRERGLPFQAWLYRLASTRVNRWLRSHGRQVRVLIEEPLDARADPSAGQAEARELARAALLRLPPRYQTTLTLHHLEGLSVAEVARTMGCRQGTVKARLSRGRERLRRELGPLAEEHLL